MGGFPILTVLIALPVVAAIACLFADAKAAALAFMHATLPFHHPAMIARQPVLTEENARAVFTLVLAGLRAGMT